MIPRRRRRKGERETVCIEIGDLSKLIAAELCRVDDVMGAAANRVLRWNNC